MAVIDKYPLQWPIGYPRTRYPGTSAFGNHPFGKCRDEVFKQLGMMLNYEEKKTIVLSTNIPLKLDGFPYANYRQPTDVGVTVYFKYKGENVVICCDKWKKIEDNLWACAKTIEAMRGIDRWGVSDFMKRSFTGFTALPPKEEDVKKEWWEVMGYSERPGGFHWGWEEVAIQYKSLAKKLHPDMNGGSVTKFQELQEAFEKAKKYYGRG